MNHLNQETINEMDKINEIEQQVNKKTWSTKQIATCSNQEQGDLQYEFTEFYSDTKPRSCKNWKGNSLKNKCTS